MLDQETIEAIRQIVHDQLGRQDRAHDLCAYCEGRFPIRAMNYS